MSKMKELLTRHMQLRRELMDLDTEIYKLSKKIKDEGDYIIIKTNNDYYRSIVHSEDGELEPWPPEKSLYNLKKILSKLNGQKPIAVVE